MKKKVSRTIVNIYVFIFGRKIFYPINKILYQIALRSIGVNNFENLYISGEIWVLRNIVNKVNRKICVFDVGANIGDYSNNLMRFCSNIEMIYSFEPNPSAYNELCINTSNIDKIQSYNIALSSSVGDKLLYTDKLNMTTSHASLSKDIFNNLYKYDYIATNIKTETIDNFCKKNKINDIDFLKIDVEGNEFEVLAGADQMIKNKRIHIIQFEFSHLNIYTRTTFMDFYDYLIPYYRLYRVMASGIQEIHDYNILYCEIYGFQNILAVSRK